MKKLVLAMSLWSGILLGQNYYIEQIGKHEIEYTVDFTRGGDGIFVDTYQITARIFKNKVLESGCSTTYSCMDCPDDTAAWLDEMRYLDWNCLPNYDINICDIIQCKKKGSTVFWKDHTFDGGK